MEQLMYLGIFKFQSDSINTMSILINVLPSLLFKFQSDSINTRMISICLMNLSALNSNLILLIPSSPQGSLTKQQTLNSNLILLILISVLANLTEEQL